VRAAAGQAAAANKKTPPSAGGGGPAAEQRRGGGGAPAGRRHDCGFAGGICSEKSTACRCLVRAPMDMRSGFAWRQKHSAALLFIA